MTTPEQNEQKEGVSGRFGKLRERVEEFNRTLQERAVELEQSVRTGIKSKLPGDAVEHLSNSKREFLLFVRKVVDRELERSDSKAGESQDVSARPAGEGQIVSSNAQPTGGRDRQEDGDRSGHVIG